MHLPNCHLLFTSELKFHSNWFEVAIIYVINIYICDHRFFFKFGFKVPRLCVFPRSASASRT